MDLVIDNPGQKRDKKVIFNDVVNLYIIDNQY